MMGFGVTSGDRFNSDYNLFPSRQAGCKLSVKVKNPWILMDRPVENQENDAQPKTGGGLWADKRSSPTESETRSKRLPPAQRCRTNLDPGLVIRNGLGDNIQHTTATLHVTVGASASGKTNVVAPVAAGSVRLALWNAASAVAVKAGSLASNGSRVLSGSESGFVEWFAEGHGTHVGNQDGRILVRAGARRGGGRQGAVLAAEVGTVFAVLGNAAAVCAISLRIARCS